MDHSSIAESDITSEVNNKSVSLPFITYYNNDNNEDLLLQSSYSYQELIYHRNTGKYVMKSGIYNYTHHDILGKNYSSENEVCTRRLTENNADSASCIKQSEIEKMQLKPMKIRTLETRNTNEQKRNYSYYFYSCFNILFIFLFVIIFGRYLTTIISTETESFENLEHKLCTKVLNQNIAISTLNRSVKKLYEQGNTKVLTCLVGSTGVGKTYSINTLQKIVNYKIIHVFDSSVLPNFIQERESVSSLLLQRIISSDHIIVVFDDLKIEDLKDVQSFIEIISKIEEINILLIFIFNIQNTDNDFNVSINYTDVAIIKENLESLFQHFYFAQFNQLNETVIRAWLKRELQFQNVPENNHDRIINNLLSVHDINSYGLKGMSSKLLIELSDNF